MRHFFLRDLKIPEWAQFIAKPYGIFEMAFITHFLLLYAYIVTPGYCKTRNI